MRTTLILPLWPPLHCGLAQDNSHLLSKATFSRTHIVFAYAGDLWSVPRAGGEAIRLTTRPATKPIRRSRRMARRSPSPANTTATWMST